MTFSSGYIRGSETIEHENLLNEVVVRSPAETPLLATLPSFDMPRVFQEWGLDRPYTSTDGVRNIGSPHENSRTEAAEWTTRAAHYQTRPRCIAEIMHFGMQISGTDMKAKIAGQNDNFDKRSADLSTTLLNNLENVLMMGQGSPVVDGSTADERRTMGLIFSSAWTGLERTSGSTLAGIRDPYDIQIASDFWSVFYNANRNPLTRTMLYRQVIVPLLRAGGSMDKPWIFHCGYGLMSRIADFLQDPSGAQINTRTVDAAAAEGYDYIAWMRMPSGHRVGFRTNRYLDAAGSTYSVDNTNYTPGSPNNIAGSVAAITFQGDETIIGYEPGTASVGWYRAPHFVNVPTTGDYVQLQAVAEFAFRLKSPLCAAGAGNCGGL